MSVLTITLAVLWASLLWAIVIGIPFALPAATLVVGLLALRTTGPVPPAGCLIAALLAEVTARRLDRSAASSGVRQALILGGGIAALGMAAGPDVGGLLAGLSLGRSGRITLTRAAVALGSVAISRLVRGGAALGIAVWLFSTR